MSKSKHKIVVETRGTSYCWWAYIENGKNICSQERMDTLANTLRSARRFARKFVDPPEVVVEKEQ